MFSTGQLVFATLFLIGFTAVIIFSYRKDKKMHLKNYKGVKWVGFFFAIFIITLFFIKYLIKI